MFKKRSFFEKLTGGVRLDDEDLEFENPRPKVYSPQVKSKDAPREIEKEENWLEEEEPEGELTIDVYQTPTDIIIHSMVAGVKPEDLHINITREMVTIKGKREENKTITKDNYFSQELYWGSFSRTILLPQEVEPEEAEAIEKHGLLTIKLPKVDREKQTHLKVKSI
jgi:HSP20 family protein